MKTVTRAVRITGKVQGVAYRAWTRNHALQLGLSGWVRNESDGSVSALFHGPDKAVEQMISDCYGGPGSAAVRDVAVEPADPPSGSGFEILR